MTEQAKGRKYEKKPEDTYEIRIRTCNKCLHPKPMRGYLTDSGWWRAIDHRCKHCSESKDVKEHQGGGFDWPAGTEWGTARAVKRAKGVENTDHFRLGWANRMRTRHGEG